jgi:rhodanese-related sulfurtransferase
MTARDLCSLAIAGTLAFASSFALAAEDTPNAIPGGTFINVDQAKTHYDKGSLFIDARVAAEYAEKHIKGAVSVPFKEQFPKVAKTGPEDKIDLAKLPGDKNKAMVFYCNGSPCWKGYKAADAAIKAGYKKVSWFRDGIPAWEGKGLPTE